MKNRLLYFVMRSASPLSSHSNPTFLLIKHNSSSSSSAETPNQEEELINKANLLITRLSESNHLHEAIRLVDALLLTNPPLNSLSLSLLIDRISNEPHMIHSMSFLNRLKHNPTAHSALPSIARMLLHSYFNQRKIKESMKLFSWMLKNAPQFDCVPDAMDYELVVRELCRNSRVMEALKVLKTMVVADMVPGTDTRNWVFRSLLREARIKEAQELNKALVDCACSCVEDTVDENQNQNQQVVTLLDEILAKWKE